MITMRDRYRGCLLGGAVGDALGAGIEFSSLVEIRREYGPAGVTGYVPCYGRSCAITDDTQMTLFTAEGLLDGLEGRKVITQVADDLYDVFACGREPSSQRYPA